MANCYIYTHYTFGIGHLQRAKLLAEGIKKYSSFRPILLCSGASVPSSFIPKTLFIKLPGEIKLNYKSKITKSESLKFSKEKINEIRIKKILNLFKKYKPDIFITEFFPFGWIRLNKTLVPILEYIKQNYPHCMIFCSARDIPISDREDLKEYDFKRLNKFFKRYYNFIFIHSPKSFSIFKKGEKFAYFDPKVPTYFTGYMVRSHKNFKKNNSKKRILITVGAGRDGSNFVTKALKSIEKINKSRPVSVRVVKGPFSSVEYSKWQEKKWCRIYDSVPNLMAWINTSDLVVCMAGYNTISEIMVSNVPALIYPRPKSFEQQKRARFVSNNSKRRFLVTDRTSISEMSNKIEFLLKMKPIKSKDLSKFKGIFNTVELIKQKFKQNV